jgi:hypothetical protein
MKNASGLKDKNAVYRYELRSMVCKFRMLSTGPILLFSIMARDVLGSKFCPMIG